MPACVKRIDKKWRVVECNTDTIVKNKKGTAVDGGGHASKSDAVRQAQAINARTQS